MALWHMTIVLTLLAVGSDACSKYFKGKLFAVYLLKMPLIDPFGEWAMHIEPFVHNANAKDECKMEYESLSKILKQAFLFKNFV